MANGETAFKTSFKACFALYILFKVSLATYSRVKITVTISSRLSNTALNRSYNRDSVSRTTKITDEIINRIRNFSSCVLGSFSSGNKVWLR